MGVRQGNPAQKTPRKDRRAGTSERRGQSGLRCEGDVEVRLIELIGSERAAHIERGE